MANKDRKDIIQGEKRCPVCDKDLTGMRITDVGNHIKWCKFRQNPDDTYKKIKQENDLKRYGFLKKFKVICHLCGKQFQVEQREKSFPKKKKYYCSRSCANVRDIETLKKSQEKVWTPQKRLQVSNYTKKLWQDPQYSKKVLSSKNKYFTSKGQRMIRGYIVEKYKEDKWTWGALNKRYKGYLFNPDMFSHKLKIVFEYDGEGHFKPLYLDEEEFKRAKIKQQVLQQWCLQNGYKLLRISESWFRSIGKDVSIVQNLLYSLNKSVTKLGKEFQQQLEI